ncbi:MAG: alpha/beta fold hydrolase [Planctomycetaceae bacterium]|nr:alpha/beta fold hydrolase [Planctomycetaceae bacterium]
MRTSFLILLLGGFALTGCGGNARSPAPEAARHDEPEAGASPDRSVEVDRNAPSTLVRVFYGTNRAATTSTDPGDFYSSARGPLQFGVCDVSIPRVHQTGELEAPSIWKLEFRENPKKHVMLVSVEPTDGSRFLSELQSTISRSEDQEAFIFVHGYNVTFEDAARRTAQIAYDLKFRGAPILFSWPAQGDLVDYTIDENTAAWAESQATEFLEAVALSCGAKRIHLIAHSMGNRIVARALERMVRQPSFGAVPEYNQVVLTAPDIDAEIFKRDIAPRIVQAAERVVIYASSNDRALVASNKFHGFSRLGQAGRHLTLFPEIPKIEVIDASAVDTSLFGLRHSYYASSDLVLTDLGRVLRGLPPKERNLTADRSGQAWTLLKSAVAGNPAIRH